MVKVRHPAIKNRLGNQPATIIIIIAGTGHTGAETTFQALSNRLRPIVHLNNRRALNYPYLLHLMYQTLLPVLQQELEKIKEAGLYKKERTLTGPQGP